MTKKCQHWWLFEEPNGAASKGTCKKCGAAIEQPNSVPDGPNPWRMGRRQRPRNELGMEARG